MDSKYFIYLIVFEEFFIKILSNFDRFILLNGWERAQQKLRGEVSPSAGYNKTKKILFPGISTEISGIALV